MYFNVEALSKTEGLKKRDLTPKQFVLFHFLAQPVVNCSLGESH